MSPPRDEVRRFVDEHLPEASLTPLAGDASTRRFFRVRATEGRTAVLMDYGACFSGDSDDILLSRIFLDAGLPVAAVLAASPAAGCLLLEDLGDTTLESALERAAPGEAARLLERAVRLAADVALRGTPVLAASERNPGPRLDTERFRFEMEFFLEHYVSGWRGCPTAVGDLREDLQRLADASARTPRPVLCHRDYHSRNLMVRRDGSLAMVDIQDARWGPDSYDLASLLFDAYVDLPAGSLERSIALFRELTGPDDGAFGERFERVAAQRMLKALGTFGYQIGTLGRERYRSAVPRTLARLDRLLTVVPGTDRLHRALDRTGLLRLR